MIVSTDDLSKDYGSTQALASVHLAVPEGSVYGLVGPNGAGKTTLLAILSGLRHATRGRVELGVPPTRIGVLPDTPRFEKWLTGREVVELAAGLGLDTAPQDTEGVIGAAGLGADADRRVGGYSRGMLQRLGLAATVVANPQLLLLDEPASALDPSGRREVLDLVAAMRGQATVMFSSHILDDVQEVCDQVGILRRGELVYQGSVDDLLAGRSGDAYLVTLGSEAEGVADSLRPQSWVREVRLIDQQSIRIEVSSLEEAQRNLVPVLAAAGARVISLQPVVTSLEEVFLELTE